MSVRYVMGAHLPPNFRTVCHADGSVDFYRGGQPPDALSWSEVADVLVAPGEKGYVIKLNTLDQGDDGPAEKYGLTVVHHPITSAEQVLEPLENLQAIRAALGAMRALRPLFLHCLRGAERTGTLVALYRVEFCGWSKERAWNEALGCGLREWMVPALVDIWQNWRG